MGFRDFSTSIQKNGKEWIRVYTHAVAKAYLLKSLTRDAMQMKKENILAIQWINSNDKPKIQFSNQKVGSIVEMCASLQQSGVEVSNLIQSTAG